MLFGAGWGLTGLCPGPAMINFFVVPSHVVFFMLPCAAGMFAVQAVKERLTTSDGNRNGDGTGKGQGQ